MTMLEGTEGIANLICFTCRMSLLDENHPVAASPEDWPDFFLPPYLSLAIEGAVEDNPQEFELNVWFGQPFDIIALEEKAQEAGFKLTQTKLVRCGYDEQQTLEDNYSAQEQRDQFQTKNLVFIRNAEATQAITSEIPLQKKIIHLWSPLAFGDGFHPTSALCVEALEALYEQSKETEIRDRAFLDIGTGSGILALAAYHFWKMPVYATDIEQNAVDTLEANWRRNHFSQDSLIAVRDEDLSAPIIAAHKPYGILCANIIQEALLILLPKMAQLQECQGQLILSGYLEQQAAKIDAQATAQGYKQHSQTVRDGWVCGRYIKQ